MNEEETYIPFSDAAELAALKAAPLFNLFGWTYHDIDSPPSAIRLQNSIKSLLDSCHKDKNRSSASGRFCVVRTQSANGGFQYHVYLELSEVTIPA